MSQLPADPTPPMHSDFDSSGEPPAWPKVVGIISIVLSSLNIVCGGCGLIFLAFMGQFLKMAEQQMGPAPAVLIPGPAIILVGVLGWIWAFLLLVAGIATLRRRPNGRTLHMTWALVAIVLTIASTLLNLQYQAAVQHWVAANPTDKWAQSQNPAGQYVGLCLGLVIGFAYPSAGMSLVFVDDTVPQIVKINGP